MQSVYLCISAPFLSTIFPFSVSVTSCCEKEIFMNRSKVFYAFSSSLRCIRPSYVLAGSWVAGLFLGTAYGCRVDHSFLLLMRIAISSHTSIVGLARLLYIPLLLAALAVCFHYPQWLITVCFSKAFLFAACSASLYAAFGSAAWLIRIMLQFSDTCTLPFLYWFCMRNISDLHEKFRFDLLVCLVAATILGLFDFCVISPFLVKLIVI